MSTFDLTICPSVNRLYCNVRGRGRVKTAEYRSWLKTAGWEVRAHKLPPVVGPYQVVIGVPLKMRGDASNRQKATLDLLVKVGATDDDKFCDQVTVRRDPDAEPGRMIVRVTPIVNGELDAIPTPETAPSSMPRDVAAPKRDAAKLRACPKCQALAGNPCVGKRGARTSVHRERMAS